MKKHEQNILRDAFLLILIGIAMVSSFSCKKFVEANKSTDLLIAKQVFTNQGSANSAIAGIYRNLRDVTPLPTMIYNSLASDDLRNYFNTTPLYEEYQNNQLMPINSYAEWSENYRIIYACNSALEGLEANDALNEAARNNFIAEAKFNRAYCYFYLVNLYGEVPLLKTTDLDINGRQGRNTVDEIYELIISDLTDAQSKLRADYSFTGGDKDRANKWAATAMLARSYLYKQDWKNAEDQANLVINSGQYSLMEDISGIFNRNNNEAILQYANSSTDRNEPTAYLIFNGSPLQVCSNNLLAAFEPKDLRKAKWIKSNVYSATGETLNFVNKFTISTVSTAELYTPIRLSEVYLIRAEARARQNNLKGCIDDINLIRLKHGGLATVLPIPIDQNGAIDQVLHERQVELFTEGMHRWFDLKRTGKLNTVMTAEKPLTWKSTSAMYPIPLSDLQKNINLKQNNGYN